LLGGSEILRVAIYELLLLSKVSVSETIEYRRRKSRRRRISNWDDSKVTTTTATTKKILTPFQAQRVLLMGRLRELVINGHSPLAIQTELGISQRQYYRLYQKAFEHDCKLIEQWDSDTFREDFAIYKARKEKILAFLMDKMDDPKAHDITRVKAAQLALELSTELFKTSREGVIQIRSEVESERESEMRKASSSFPFQEYLARKGIIFISYEHLKKVLRQFSREQGEGEGKKRRIKRIRACNLLADDDLYYYLRGRVNITRFNVVKVEDYFFLFNILDNLSI
jgi:hypothetical protein